MNRSVDSGKSKGSRSSSKKGNSDAEEGDSFRSGSNGDSPNAKSSRRRPTNHKQGVHNSDLDELERLLQEQVDPDFFQDPKVFHTLQRVIDVLGAQLLEDTSNRNTPYSTKEYENLRKHNPAYKALKKQQQVVEDAIEHLAVVHCAELNQSVVQVGRVARQFKDAVTKVRELRQQVNDIQETLGSNSHPSGEDASGVVMTTRDGASAAAMSLRELWLKKLECESVMTLLEKMEILRASPTQFDMCIRPRNGGACRIGAAVLTLSSALAIAFEHSVSHVAALHSITKQLLERQQIAEDIIWKTLQDVLYLRTGNGIVKEKGTKPATAKRIVSSAASVSSKRSAGTSSILQNPFVPRQGRLRSLAEDEELDNESVQSYDSDDTSFFSRDSSKGSKQNSTVSTAATSTAGSYAGLSTRMMIPMHTLDAEMDLEADERRCLENTFGLPSSSSNSWDRSLPRYADHVMALRILVECLAKLRRLADVERQLSEELHSELRRVAQIEQARTLARLERRSHKRHARDLKEFRRHLTGLLSSFGCVMVRYSHLAQILRHRIMTDKEPVLYDENGNVRDPSTFMHHVLVSAFDFMQREIKDFLTACLKETEKSASEDGVASNGISSHERGFFSLGIASDVNKQEAGYGSLAASRASTMELPADQFVALVLFPKTNNTPQVRHALEFRKALAKWTSENDALKKELALVSGQDTSSPSYQMETEQTALDLLDSVIKKQLIPILQDDALNGTTHALERGDAFDPVIDRTLYGRPNSNEPQDVDMCVACQAVYYSTGPLFQALHRLPRDEKMYLHIVGVLEHAVLTFISRIKPRVNQICNGKMALRLLLDSGKEGKDKSFNQIVERRRAFAQLLQAYADGDLLEATNTVEEAADLNKDSGLAPLAPPVNDTQARRASGTDVASPSAASDLDFGGGVEREEQNLILELSHLQSILEFTKDSHSSSIVVCSDEDLMKASCLAHSLLKLSSLLESRLRVRGSGSFEKVLTSTRALREAIKTIKTHGIKMAKFCRIDMLLQTVTRLSKICKSSTLVAKDAVRIPSCVNDLGEYMTAASDNLREAAGNAVTAYTLSSLEQYIPLFLMQTVRVIAHGEGIVSKAPLTLNGIEALDRSGSVLYRDLKGATSFDNSFWDDELAAISFERSASFMAMMELEMEELEAYYRANNEDFAEEDFKLMFAMNGPRRRGDIGRYHMVKKKLGPK